MKNFEQELEAEKEKKIKKKLKEGMTAIMKDSMKKLSRMIASEEEVSEEKVKNMAEEMFGIYEKDDEEETEEKKFVNKMKEE